MQILTLDEDRQHGLTRGAFSFLTKPTSSEGIEQALSRIRDYVVPRRRRLLVVEDNPAEQLSSGEPLAHDDIEIEIAASGQQAIATLRNTSFDCVVLDLRLPDMSGFEIRRSSMLCFSGGRSDTTRCRNRAVSSRRRSGDSTPLTTTLRAIVRSRASSSAGPRGRR